MSRDWHYNMKSTDPIITALCLLLAVSLTHSFVNNNNILTSYRKYVVPSHLASIMSNGRPEIDLTIKSDPVHRYDIIKKLQKASNGFDLRGCTCMTTDGPLLSNEAAFWVGVGFSEYIKTLNHQSHINGQVLRIGLGRDPRESGIDLSRWLASGIEANGVEAYDVGLATTPSMFLSCSKELLDNIFIKIN